MKKDKLSKIEALLSQDKVEEALRQCKSFCRKNRTNVNAWMLLGMIYGQLNDFLNAEKSFAQVLQIQPNLAEGYYNLGKSQESLGKLSDAEHNYAQAVHLNPKFAQAFNNLGAVKIAVGKVDEAEQNFLSAITIQPKYPMVYRNLGMLYQRLERLDEAEKAYEKALKIEPNFLNVVSSLAGMMMDVERYDEAKKYLLHALKLQPENPGSHANLGRYYRLMNDHNEAAKYYSTALSLQPDFLPGLLGMGTLKQKAAELTGAAECYQKVLALQPNNQQALNSLGMVFVEQAKYEEAKVCFEKTLELDPSQNDIKLNYVNALSGLGELENSVQVLQSLLELEPDNIDAQIRLAGLLLSQGRVKEADQCYRNMLAVESELAKKTNAHLLPMNYSNLYDRQQKFEAHLSWGERQETTDEAIKTFANEKDVERVLRIGYVSPDFRNHSVAYFFEPIIGNHNKQKFEIYCYSDASREDVVTERIKRQADYWRECSGLSHDALEAMIREDEIDILIDLAGHSKGNRLPVFAKRAAPVQVSYLGYPNTTGLKTVDYLITDGFCDPEGDSDAFYTESLIRMSPTCYCYSPPSDAPEVLLLPAKENGYITFASYNNLMKIDEGVIELWCKVLNSVPDSKMLMQCLSLNDAPTKERYLKYFATHGILSDRLTLRSSSDFSSYLSSHNQVDIILDTFPWAGHTITCHALLMGVPVVMLAGDDRASRMGFSTLQNLGLTECVAFSKEEYVEKAVALAGNLPWLEEMRKYLRSQLMESHLCDGEQFTKKLEEEYRLMWSKWCGD